MDECFSRLSNTSTNVHELELSQKITNKNTISVPHPNTTLVEYYLLFDRDTNLENYQYLIGCTALNNKDLKNKY